MSSEVQKNSGTWLSWEAGEVEKKYFYVFFPSDRFKFPKALCPW